MRARSRQGSGDPADLHGRSRRTGSFWPRATLTRRILFINVLALAILGYKRPKPPHQPDREFTPVSRERQDKLAKDKE